MPSAPPILWMPIYTADEQDRSRVTDALAAIGRADPAVLIRTDPETNELLVSGISLDHLQDTFSKITGEYRVPAWKGDPRVRYVETISKTAEGEGKYIRQTGGLGNYGHVKLRLEPADPGVGITFVNAIQGGVIPPEFIPSVETGVRVAAQSGLFAGHEVAGLTVTLFDGSFHEVDSNDMAFKIAASLAFKEAARKGRPVILEPVMAVSFTVPEAEQAQVMMEISRRRGQIAAVETKVGIACTRATVPLEELLGYDDPALHIESFAGYREKPSRQNPADEAGVIARRPRGPSPKDSSSAAEPDWDWT